MGAGMGGNVAGFRFGGERAEYVILWRVAVVHRMPPISGIQPPLLIVRPLCRTLRIARAMLRGYADPVNRCAPTSPSSPEGRWPVACSPCGTLGSRRKRPA